MQQAEEADTTAATGASAGNSEEISGETISAVLHDPVSGMEAPLDTLREIVSNLHVLSFAVEAIPNLVDPRTTTEHVRAVLTDAEFNLGKALDRLSALHDEASYALHLIRGAAR